MNVNVPTRDLITHNVDMHTQVHRGVAGLHSLRTQWEGLHVYCDLWSRFEWYHAYVTSLAVDSESIYFIQVIAGEETVAIIPSEISRQRIDPFGNLKVLCLAFHSHIILTDFPLNQYVDPAKVAEQMLKAFRKLPDRWDVIRWPRIMHSSNALMIARAINGYTVYTRPAQPCNTFNTSNSLDAIFNSLSTKTRTNLRRARKRLTDASSWHIETNRSADDFGPSYEDFLRLESSGWKGESGSGSAINLNKGTRNFYATLLEQRSLDFVPEVTLLICESNAIAGQFTVLTRGWKHLLKIGYDEFYSKLAPGQILLEEALGSACVSTSIERYSLVSSMPWHLQWQPEHGETFDVIVFRRRLFGVVFGWYLASRRLAKSLFTMVKEMYGKKNTS